jgi:hypothetical protein
MEAGIGSEKIVSFSAQGLIFRGLPSNVGNELRK